MKQINTIIWDWNGTLLDDVHISLISVNHLLAERRLEKLTHERYLDIFTFPVQKYYESLGFDFDSEPFEITALQFIEIYNAAVIDCGLHHDVIDVLTRVKAKGLKQFILSAMEQQLLEETVGQNNIIGFFNAVYGLNHHNATSKIETGMILIAENNLSPLQTLLVGDTIHDFEVAQSIGCQCILVANGHQSRKRLEATGAKVIKNLSELRI